LDHAEQRLPTSVSIESLPFSSLADVEAQRMLPEASDFNQTRTFLLCCATNIPPFDVMLFSNGPQVPRAAFSPAGRLKQAGNNKKPRFQFLILSLGFGSVQRSATWPE
jgi:hypothetical protein